MRANAAQFTEQVALTLRIQSRMEEDIQTDLSRRGPHAGYMIHDTHFIEGVAVPLSRQELKFMLHDRRRQ